VTAPANRRDLGRQLEALGVERGTILVVHTSFKSIGPIDDGPRGVTEALLDAVGSSGTLVMPAMSDSDDVVFDPAQTPARAMGVVADMFWRMPGVLRSDSPHSFAAIGPQAAAITAPHPPEIPHGPDSPIGRAHDLDASVLLLGVGHDANTTVHLGEWYARVPYRLSKSCVVLRDGVPALVDYGEIDHCCRNFSLVGDWLEARGLERRGQVGRGIARLMRARDVVATVVDELTSQPCRFLCPRGTGCDECDLAWASVR
jgi:aminoglycoside 3-N-acetyltransferase